MSNDLAKLLPLCREGRFVTRAQLHPKSVPMETHWDRCWDDFQRGMRAPEIIVYMSDVWCQSLYERDGRSWENGTSFLDG